MMLRADKHWPGQHLPLNEYHFFSSSFLPERVSGLLFSEGSLASQLFRAPRVPPAAGHVTHTWKSMRLWPVYVTSRAQLDICFLLPVFSYSLGVTLPGPRKARAGLVTSPPTRALHGNPLS